MKNPIPVNDAQAEVEALARAIQADNPELSLVEILKQASELYDDLMAWAAGWDACARVTSAR